VLCVLLVRFSSIGDIVLTTPLVRALARRHPEAKLVYVTKRALAPLVADNPHLAEVVALEPDEPLRHLARRLTALAPTHGLDLHGSVRSVALRLLVRCRWSGYRKRKPARTLLIATKLDAYRRRVPVPERYFEAAARLDARPDGGPPEFWLGRGATERVAHWLVEHGLADAKLAALAPGAAHATKRWPVAHWSALIEQSAGRKIAASPSSSSPAARRRAPPESSHCRKPEPCWREPPSPSQEIPASCTWRPGSGPP